MEKYGSGEYKSYPGSAVDRAIKAGRPPGSSVQRAIDKGRPPGSVVEDAIRRGNPPGSAVERATRAGDYPGSRVDRAIRGESSFSSEGSATLLNDVVIAFNTAPDDFEVTAPQVESEHSADSIARSAPRRIASVFRRES